jgi:nitrite reductase/ring-hydroxylating ferredoxin subunit
MIDPRQDSEVVWAGSMSDLPVGALTPIAAGDKPTRRICLANVDGTVFAFEDVCPHRGGRLSNGTLAGNVVQCPLHGWRFNVESGAGLGPGSRRLTVYPVESWDGRLTVYSAPVRRRKGLFEIGKLLLSRLRRSRRSEPGPTPAT